MKTKDLLEDLETGDRTMEHLKEEPILQQQVFLWTIPTISESTIQQLHDS